MAPASRHGWKAAERFNRIDPSKDGEQQLISDRLPGYNFDQIQGDLSYQIDVTKPAANASSSSATRASR